MTQLIPCPGCNRHVRQAESSCPFCSAQLSLSHVPEHALPRTRLGRAATFAFGATLVGATALVGCGGESEGKKEGGGGTGGTAQAGSGGSSAGQNAGGTGITPVYGAPAAGTGNEAGSSSGGNQGTAGGTGFGGGPVYGGAPAYGAPAAGSGNMGGFTGIPVYGAAPAD